MATAVRDVAAAPELVRYPLSHCGSSVACLGVVCVAVGCQRHACTTPHWSNHLTTDQGGDQSTYSSLLLADRPTPGLTSPGCTHSSQDHRLSRQRRHGKLQTHTLPDHVISRANTTSGHMRGLQGRSSITPVSSCCATPGGVASAGSATHQVTISRPCGLLL
jgi:hypothetical protein